MQMAYPKNCNKQKLVIPCGLSVKGAYVGGEKKNDTIDTMIDEVSTDNQ